ncbi:C-5 cytosine methyltransferase DmtA [Penicillium brasilianum]|uniref:DNA (cytosine-5-)-methyltransferase n=1 Tax=Penicillium brasilianum TaxID=104259 RepID=A0A1S9RY06_PENBI|nr:C-5 cytosine methyltransferase DmtA [Penicillium brasilianum]
MTPEIIDLSSGSESGEPYDHYPDKTLLSPSASLPLTSKSHEMEDWPEDKPEMPRRSSHVTCTQPDLSMIMIDDDSIMEISHSSPTSPSEPSSPDMGEWGWVHHDPRRSKQGRSAKAYPSFKDVGRLFHRLDPEDPSDSSRSLILDNSSSQSTTDDSFTTVSGSSSTNPIDLSEIEDDLCALHVELGHRLSVVQDPRRQFATPRATLAGEIDHVELNGEILHPSSSIRLVNGSYLRIEWITQREGQVCFWGRHLVGCHDSQWPLCIPQDEHELVWIPKMDHETNLVSIESHLPVSPMEVAGLCEVIFTNERRGKNTNHPPGAGLFCRLKMTARKRPKISPHRSGGLQPSRTPEYDTSVEFLTLDECDEGYGFESHVLRDLYRGCTTVPFGEGQVGYTGPPTVTDDEQGSREVIDLTVDPTAYMFGDAYCGAGGTSCGAKQAGLQLKWACDLDPFAVSTYGLNFHIEIDHCSFNDLLTHSKEYLRVDVAHCSPPCQTYSPAHTINCDRDDDNSACIFSAGNLMEHARPRILTMEETAGLKERFPAILNRVIMDMIEAGYSVRWAVIDVLHYGVPQTRKRLIIIAAGPGETLPSFPEITHDLPGSGCLPVVTINDTITNIPDDAPDHDVQSLLRNWSRQWRAPFDGRQLAKTLTCSGGEGNYHPSGRRKFTHREVACLQTFPMNFQFADKGVRKQVGNAVPPALAKALYTEIISSLRATDAREREEKRERERQQVIAGRE